MRDGSLITYLSENRLDARHPDAPYLADNAPRNSAPSRPPTASCCTIGFSSRRDFDPDSRYPAIVDVYGGPGVQRVLDNLERPSFTQILTRAGYVVFQLDNRGSASAAPHSRRHPCRLGDVEVADQVLGARWLASSPSSSLAHRRVGLELRRLHDAHDDVQGARGVSSRRLGRAGHRFGALRYPLHRALPGSPPDNAAGYEASSVLPYAKDLRGKLLVIHGMADDNVLFLNSTKLFRRLQDLGKPFDIMVYPGAKHGLLRQHDGGTPWPRYCDSSTIVCAPRASRAGDLVRACGRYGRGRFARCGHNAESSRPDPNRCAGRRMRARP